MATYDYLKSKNGHKIQVESAKRDGSGKNIENNYAKQNGYYKQLTGGLADNLTPYSEDSGVHQENPFISNGTGTNNNQEIVTVGDYALVQEKQGNSVVVNQLATITLQTGTYGGNLTITNNDNGTLTLNGSTTSDVYNKIKAGAFTCLAKHYYLISTNTNNADCIIGFYASGQTNYFTQNGLIIAKYNIEVNAEFQFTISSGKSFNNLTIRPLIIDLTQMFNGNVPQDLLDNPSHFSWYYNGSLAYNTGSLESANGVKLVSTGRNQWDEQWESGTINNGVNQESSNQIRSKNYTRVIPNTTYYAKIGNLNGTNIGISYYDKDKQFIKKESANSSTNLFTTPSNCEFIRFNMSYAYGTTYNHDITISLYYTPEQGGEGYDKYYPYEEPTIVNTGNESLLSAGNVKDYKTKDGVIHKVVGVVDLGTLNWTYQSAYGGGAFLSPNLSNGVPVSGGKGKANAFCTKYVIVENKQIENNDKVMAVGAYWAAGCNIYVKDSSYGTDAATFKTAMSGVILYYELAEETTEQGTPYPETLPINDYGMLYWLDENDNLVGIPQGAKIFFPVNYKGFVDDVYSRTSGDAGNLVVESELSEYVKQVDLSSQITDVAGLTYQYKKAIKTGNVVTITIQADNSTGNSINAGDTLFKIGSALQPSMNIVCFCRISEANTEIELGASGVSGNCSLGSALSNGASMRFTVSYIVE